MIHSLGMILSQHGARVDSFEKDYSGVGEPQEVPIRKERQSATRRYAVDTNLKQLAGSRTGLEYISGVGTGCRSVRKEIRRMISIMPIAFRFGSLVGSFDVGLLDIS